MITDVQAILRVPERYNVSGNTYVHVVHSASERDVHIYIHTVLGAPERDDNRCTSRS